MKIVVGWLSILVLLTLASGCADDAQEGQSAPTSARVAANDPNGGTTSGEDDSDATIRIVPARAGCTPEGAYFGTVRWRTSEEGFVTITVGPRGSLFAEARGTSGEHPTGEWVIPGLRFALNRPSGETLATVDAGPGDCESPARG